MCIGEFDFEFYFLKFFANFNIFQTLDLGNGNSNQISTSRFEKKILISLSRGNFRMVILHGRKCEDYTFI